MRAILLILVLGIQGAFAFDSIHCWSQEGDLAYEIRQTNRFWGLGGKELQILEGRASRWRRLCSEPRVFSHLGAMVFTCDQIPFEPTHTIRIFEGDAELQSVYEYYDWRGTKSVALRCKHK